MEKEFVNYDIALEMKQIGFDEPCFGFHNHNRELLRYMNPDKDWNSLYNQTLINSKITVPDTYTAPTFSQAFRWFREKYGLKHDIDDDNVGTKFYYKIRSYTDKFDNYNDIIKPMREERDWSKIEFYSYGEAELACLIKLIEIVKNSK